MAIIAHKEEKKTDEKAVLEFQSVAGWSMTVVENKTDPKENEYRIYKGTKGSKRLWATFYGDKESATLAMFQKYQFVLKMVLDEAQARIKDPNRVENKEAGATSPEDTPIFAKPGAIIN